MAFRHISAGARLDFCLLPLALCLSGCGTAFSPPDPPPPVAAVEDGNADPSGLRTIGAQRGEPNGAFNLAIPVLFDDAGRGALRGSIQAIGDLDVYDLGPLAGGDRVFVAVDASQSELDSSVAVFDAGQRLFIENDDSGEEDRPLDSLIAEIVRHASDHYYLVIGAAAFAGSGAERVGRYDIVVEIFPDENVPPPLRQTLLLDFDGGRVDVPTIPVSFVEPFDADQILLRCGAGHRCDVPGDIQPFAAEKIAPLYAGQDDLLKGIIIEIVRSNFRRFGVEIVTSDDPLPEEGTFSSIFFGGDNPIAFGIAESIDHYNTDPDDTVVIFTNTFQPGVFSAPPDVEELGAAIGNVASHEAGHILGLSHVDDPRDLMDAVSPPDTLLLDQEFRVTPLSDQIMPIGVQDGPLLLEETVGPSGE